MHGHQCNHVLQAKLEPIQVPHSLQDTNMGMRESCQVIRGASQELPRCFEFIGQGMGLYSEIS